MKTSLSNNGEMFFVINRLQKNNHFINYYL